MPFHCYYRVCGVVQRCGRLQYGKGCPLDWHPTTMQSTTHLCSMSDNTSSRCLCIKKQTPITRLAPHHNAIVVADCSMQCGGILEYVRGATPCYTQVCGVVHRNPGGGSKAESSSTTATMDKSTNDQLPSMWLHRFYLFELGFTAIHHSM